jgi:hypothetical protein
MEGLLKIAFNSLIAACLFFGAWIYLKSKQNNAKVCGVNREERKVKQSVTSSSMPQNQNYELPIGKHKCANCNNEGSLKSCSLCRVVFYCGKSCQMEHWKKPNGHKQHCKRAAKTTTTTTKTHNTSSNENDNFGALKTEREELIEELKELTKEEKEVLLAEWDKMSPDQLKGPSLLELETQLSSHRKELSGLVYQAAYDSMDEAETNQLVARIKDLKVMFRSSIVFL